MTETGYRWVAFFVGAPLWVSVGLIVAGVFQMSSEADDRAGEAYRRNKARRNEDQLLGGLSADESYGRKS